MRIQLKNSMAHTFVKDVMKENVISLESEMTVKDAAVKMKEKNVGCVIVTKQDTPVGIITERDFVTRIAANEKTLSTTLSEVMSSPLTVISPEETVWEAAEIMKSKGIHKVPVQEGNKVVGIITTTDLVELCSLGSDSSMREICDQILLRISETKSEK
jgi:signal-transduction protein with cAMP-binding, CBS, and nucleotidyltransferase domain